MKILITILSLTIFSLAAHADPIQDGIFKNHNAAWIKSSATPCSSVCKRVVAKAENEAFYIPGITTGKTTYDCKSLTNVALSHTTNFKAKGTLFGTNFDHLPALKRHCLVPTHTGQVQKLKNFLCLCIRKKLTIRPYDPVLTRPISVLNN